MFIVIEIDRAWTVGIDRGRYVKGIRLGFVAVHIGFVPYEEFLGRISEYYHQKKMALSGSKND